MAGHALHAAQVAHTAIDGAHHAQRQVQLVEHRPLFNMHFYKAHIVGGIALDVCDVLHLKASSVHGVLHADAIGIKLREPLRIELAHQGA